MSVGECERVRACESVTECVVGEHECVIPTLHAGLPSHG